MSAVSIVHRSQSRPRTKDCEPLACRWPFSPDCSIDARITRTPPLAQRGRQRQTQRQPHWRCSNVGLRFRSCRRFSGWCSSRRDQCRPDSRATSCRSRFSRAACERQSRRRLGHGGGLSRLVRPPAKRLGRHPASRRARMRAPIPLVDALGFDPPQDVERLDAVLVSTLRAGDEAVALIVAAWAEPLDLLSRIGCHAGDVPIRAMVRALQRHAPAAHRRCPAVLPPVRAIRSRHGRRRRGRRSRRSAYVMQRLPAALRFARRGVRAPRHRRLPIAQGRRAVGVRRCAPRAGPPGRAATWLAAAGLVRAGADDRLPDPLPALRRGARPRAGVASRVSRQLQHRGRSARSPNGPAVHAGSGRRFARSRGSPTPAAARATCA